VVEIQDWDKVAIRPDVGEAVDALLRGNLIVTEVRWLDESGEIKSRKEEPAARERAIPVRPQVSSKAVPKLYLFGVNRGRIEQVAKDMHLSPEVVGNLKEADLFVISKAYYRRKPQKVSDAEASKLPIYVLKSNTPAQIRQLLDTVYPRAGAEKQSRLKLALGEAEEAVGRVREGEGAVELSPQSAYIRRLQHLLAQRSNLASQSTGKDPNRRVRIYKG